MSTAIPESTLEKFATFGDLLRFLRRRVSITQVELAIAVGYSDGQISRLEQNLRLPDIPTLEARFVSALGLENESKAVARLVELAANIRREDAPAFGISPYKGLNYFDEADSDLFAGREALTAKLTDRVLALASSRRPHERRFLSIVGASGSGKSSLLRAGLLPALRWDQASADWRIHVLTPTANPLESLARTLTDSVAATATLMDDLARDPRSLHLFIKRATQAEHAPHALLVIDQFEELFALCRSEQVRTSFINSLLTTSSEVDGPTIIVIALRADFYAYCADYADLRAALAEQQEYIGAMSADELRRAIEEPAGRGRWELEPGLVDLLLHDVGHEPGALPLLSHALLETWQRRRGHTMTLGGYTSSGGVRGAIAETADAVFTDQFTHEEQMIARRIFLRLTELGDETTTGDTRRRATYSELILKPEEAGATRDVLKALADARLITTSGDSAEVAHEALIREWPMLRGWLEDDRESLRLHRHLSESSREWSASGRELDLLYRGARLTQVSEWAAVHSDEMNDLEREFIEASQALAAREVVEREARRQRELEAAHKLAQAERARADEQASSIKRLRQRGLLLGVALVLALVAAIFANVFARNAQRQALISSVRELSNAANLDLGVDPERSILLALQAVNKTYSIDHAVLPEAEDALHRALQASRIELTLRGHTGVVWSAVFSPDGSRILTASSDGTARVWNATNGKELLSVQGSTYSSADSEAGFVWYAAFSPDGKSFATAGGDDIARIWDANTGEQLLAFSGHHDDVYHIEFSPDGRRLATVSPDGTAMVWDALSGKVLLTLNQGGGARPYWVSFSPDGSRIAIANTADTSQGWASIWDSVTGKLLLTLPTQSAYVDSVSFSPDGRRVITTSEDAVVRIWDANNGTELLTLYGQTAGVTNAAYSPDGNQIATAIGNNQVKVCDAATGRELLTLAGHSQSVLTVGFSPDGARIVTASRDGTARIWNISPSRELLTLVNGHPIESPVGARLTYSPDGTNIAAAYADPIAKIWNVTTGKVLLNLTGHGDAVNYIAYSFDGTRIATASQDGTAKIWDAISGKELVTLSGHKGWVFGVAFSPDGKRIATSSADSTARVWDVATGKVLLTLTGHSDLVVNVVFSPDGKRLATSSFDSTAIVWDAATGKKLLTLTGHTRPIRQVVFSPDGGRLATASFDGTAKEWDAVSGKELLTLSGHVNDVLSVAFSPDGKTIATASIDKTVRLWDAATGQELLMLEAPEALTSVAFSPDSSQLAVGSRDGTVRIYLLRPEDLVRLAKHRVTRSLTTAECQQYLHAPTCPTGP